MNTLNRRKQSNNTWSAIDKNNEHNRSMHYKCQMSSQISYVNNESHQSGKGIRTTGQVIIIIWSGMSVVDVLSNWTTSLCYVMLRCQTMWRHAHSYWLPSVHYKSRSAVARGRKNWVSVHVVQLCYAGQHKQFWRWRDRRGGQWRRTRHLSHASSPQPTTSTEACRTIAALSTAAERAVFTVSTNIYFCAWFCCKCTWFTSVNA